jgi:hypothetical protein
MMDDAHFRKNLIGGLREELKAMDNVFTSNEFQ